MSGYRGVMSEPLVLTVNQVAALLQVDEDTVRTLARRRKIAKMRFCGEIRFRRSDVEAFVNGSVLPCRESPETCLGSAENPADQIGSSTGMTREPEKSPAAQRVQEMIAKHTRSLDASSRPERKPRPQSPSQSPNVVVLRSVPTNAG